MRIQRCTGFTLLLSFLALTGCGVDSELMQETFLVTRGEFVNSVTETGELAAVNSKVIVAPLISWRFGALKITSIVEDGQEVKEGDTLIQFDPNEIAKSIDEARAERDIAMAELRKATVKQASELEEKETDLEIARLNHRISELNLEQATFEAEIDRRKIELELEKASIALDNATQEIENKRNINRQEISKLELKVQQAQSKLDEADEALALLTVKAPNSGIAIIRKSWSTRQKYQVDDQPFPGWPMIGLPDLNEMKADMMINEVDISKIKVGQDAMIRLDAYPDSSFTGLVTEVASLGRNKDRDSKVKVFDVTVTLTATDQQLMPGMTVSAEIVSERLRDVLSVPLEAVFFVDDGSVVYVREGGGFLVRDVTTGRQNDNHVIITDGVAVGDEVALFDPSTVPPVDPGSGSSTTAGL